MEEAIDTMFVEQEETKGLLITLVYDKGEGEKRRDGNSFVKLVSRFDEKNGWVKVTCTSIYRVPIISPLTQHK